MLTQTAPELTIGDLVIRRNRTIYNDWKLAAGGLDIAGILEYSEMQVVSAIGSCVSELQAEWFAEAPIGRYLKTADGRGLARLYLIYEGSTVTWGWNWGANLEGIRDRSLNDLLTTITSQIFPALLEIRTDLLKFLVQAILERLRLYGTYLHPLQYVSQEEGSQKPEGSGEVFVFSYHDTSESGL